MNLSKSPIVSEKAFSIIAHLCSEMAVFGRNSTRCFEWSIRYSSFKHAVHSYLRNRTTVQTEYLMGSTVNIMLKLWVSQLSFLKRHPSIQKVKNEEYRALIGTKWIFGTIWYKPASLLGLLRDEERSKWKPRLCEKSTWKNNPVYVNHIGVDTNHNWLCFINRIIRWWM
jgi:hypothetical protein